MKQWITEHWELVSGGGLIGLLLLLWQRGFFQWVSRVVKTLRKAVRDQELIDALKACSDCETKLKEVRGALTNRVLTDDARDEIHQQDLADKKQMAATI